MNSDIRLGRLRLVVVMAALALGAVLAAPQAWAQVQSPYSASAPRTFPPTALYGVLTIKGPSSARLNGDAIALAPGMRLFGPQGQMLTPYTSVAGKKLQVRYVVEAGTGMLQTAWVLRDSEIPPRRFWGLLGPAKQDPHEVQVGPLGVGLKRDGKPGSAPAARGITGHRGIEGVRGVQGVTPMNGVK